MGALPSAAVLRAGGSALVLDLAGQRPPRVLHWGADLGPLAAEELEGLRTAAQLARGHSGFDAPIPATITRDAGEGYFGIPAVSGHRAGTAFSNRFELVDAQVHSHFADVTLIDREAELELRYWFLMADQGVLRMQATLKNLGTAAYTLNDLNIALPLSRKATQLTDFSGHWSRELHPQRREIETGTWLREGREGRTGHDHTLTFSGHTGNASFQNGEVWTVSLAWSGNSRHFVERLTDATQWIGAGELLLPGEIILSPGESYSSPLLFAVHSESGFDGVAAKFHDYLRARPHHPKRPRPLTLNVWEAVYMNHDIGKLSELADVAASIGVERFVLDDGWFGARRTDEAGLGDWVVSREVWPEGLHPLARKLEAVGLEFGLWFEPEMIQVDSDAYRAHPEWALHVGDRLPPEWRNQQVIDLSNPDAYAHVFGQIDAILSEYPTIRYIKWDHNRVVIDAAHAGHPAIHHQTKAVYKLFDELKSRHAGLEIESCASGGGRIDLGVLEHTDRVWDSDTNDALERQRIQRWTSQVLPPELQGTHIGPHHSHTSGRTHDLSFRAVTALFGHAGIEWDLTATTEAERATLRNWADYYKQNRELLHHGRMVRVDHAESAVSVHGVVAYDQRKAIFAYVQEGVSATTRPVPLRLVGLSPDMRYRVQVVAPAGDAQIWQHSPQPWMTQSVVMSGSALAQVGLSSPVLTSEQAMLIEVNAV